MNKAKRISALILSIALMMGGMAFPSPALAAAPTVTFFVSPSKTSVSPVMEGEKNVVTITVYSQQRIDDITNFSLYLEYNSDQFTFNSIDDLVSTQVGASGAVTQDTGTPGRVGLTYTNTTGAAGTHLNAGNLFRATFTLKSTARNGTYPFTSACLFSVLDAGVPTPGIVHDNFTNVTVTGATNPTLPNDTSVMIDTSNDVVIGSTLRAFVSNAPAGATAKFQWYRRSPTGTFTAISGATANEYVLVKADVGMYMRVTVQFDGYTGTREHALGTLVRKMENTTAPTAIDDPIIVNYVYDTQIILDASINTTKKFEYAISETNSTPSGNWQTSNIFDRLLPNTDYYLFARFRETDEYYASPAYMKAEPVRTTAAVHGLTFQYKSTDNNANPGSAYYVVQGGGPVVAGTKVFLYAQPKAGYFFDKWTCSDPSVVITGASLASGAYIDSMPNKNIVVTANFKPLAQPRIIISDTQLTYSTFGNPDDQGYNVKDHIEVHMVDGEDVSAANVTLYFRPEGETGPGTTTMPKNVGVYRMIALFEGDAKNQPARNDSAKLTIMPASGPTPDAIVVSAIGPDHVTFATKSGQKYLVYPYSQFDPDLNLRAWVNGTGDEYTWTGLDPATKYKIYTYIPASENYSVSPIRSHEFSTLHTWKYGVTEGGKICLSLAFFNKPVGGVVPAPGARTVTIKNTGNGAIGSLNVQLANGDTGNFQLILTDTASVLAPGASTTFQIVPIALNPAPVNAEHYEVDIVINAQQNETPYEVAAMPTITIPVSYDVSAHDPITINGLQDKTTTYNAQPQEIDKQGITLVPASFNKDDLEYTYTGMNGTPDPAGNDAPTNAGTYLVTVRPKAVTGYAGSDTAILTIDPATLRIEGLEVTARLYDGTQYASLTGGQLMGYLPSDEGQVSVQGGIPRVGVFDTKHHGVAKPVYLASLALAGAKKDNYKLVQPDIKGTIAAKPITPFFPTVDKIYDGTINMPNAVYCQFHDGDVVNGDTLTVRFTGCRVEDKEVGTNKAVILGTMIETGNTYGDYVIRTPETPFATVHPKPVAVTVSGQSEVDYDGLPKPLTAEYDVCPGDTLAVDVLYNNSPVAPWLAGTYTIGAEIRDRNYQIYGPVQGIKKLIIHNAQLKKTDVTRTMRYGNTAIKSVPVAAFGITAGSGSIVVTGDYSLGDVVDDNHILDTGYPKLENNTISFRLKPTTQAQIGQFASIPVKFTPRENTYAPIVAYLIVTIAEEGYTNSIVNAPLTVRLGEEIDLTNIRLRTVFDSDGHTEDVAITKAMMSNAYDPTDLSAGNLGVKTITVTHPQTAFRTASFNITVVDVVEDFTVKAPDKLIYEWMKDTALDLTGGMLMPTMRSGSNAEPVPLIPGMLSISNDTLKTVGKYMVNVTYQKKTKPSAFTVDVINTTNGVTENPPSGQPGVIDLDPTTEFKDGSGKAVEAKNVQLVISPIASTDIAKLLAAIAADGFFKQLEDTTIQMMDIRLVDINTNDPVQPTKSIRVRLNYPAGTTKNNTLRVIHVPKTGNPNIYQPTKRDSGLDIDVASFSPFAIGWVTSSTGDNGGNNGGNGDNNGGNNNGNNGGSGSGSKLASGGGSSTSAFPSASGNSSTFWNSVLDSITTAKKNSVIRVNARSNDQMPAEIMRALRKTNVTLVISWNGGEDITITSKKAFTPESTREYYPLSLLSELFMGDPPKTDDPEEGEAQLAQQRAEKEKASAATKPSPSKDTSKPAKVVNNADAEKFRKAVAEYMEHALEKSEGNVIDITAPQEKDEALIPVTPRDAGWVRMPNDPLPLEEVEFKLPTPTLGGPGVGGLLVILGGTFLIAAAAIGLHIRKRKLSEYDDE